MICSAPPTIPRTPAALVRSWTGLSLNAVLAQLSIERGRLQPERRGGARGAVDAAAGALQRLQDRPPLDRCQRRRIGGSRRYRQPGRVNLQQAAAAEDQGPLDQVLQLAHVAGPVVPSE